MMHLKGAIGLSALLLQNCVQQQDLVWSDILQKLLEHESEKL